MSGHNYEGLYQAFVGGVVAGASFWLIRHHLREKRIQQAAKAREKFRR